MSTLCLFIVLGGSAVAAVRLSKNSVRSKHIKNGQVRAPDLGRNAVNSSKVRNGSLLTEDFAAGQLTPGPKGDKGETGERGQPGEAGPGATALLLDRAATADLSFQTFGIAEPWEFMSRCALTSGNVEFRMTVGGQGTGVLQLVSLTTDDDDSTTIAQSTLGKGVPAATSGGTVLVNTMVDPGHYRRFAQTVLFQDGEALWTATLNFIADNRAPTDPRCFGYGTVVPAS